MRAVRPMHAKRGSVARWVCLACALAVWISLHAASAAGDAATPPLIYDPQLISFGSWSYADEDRATSDLPDPELRVWTPMGAGTARPPFGKGVRWYRTEFTIGWQYRTRNLGIWLGRAGQAHRVYVNGHVIGSGGGFGSGFVDASRKSSVLPIENNKLWFSFLNLVRSNELVVRVEAVNAPVSLDAVSVQIDDLDKLLLDSRTSDTYVKIAEGGALSVLVLIGVFCGFLFLSGFRARSNTVFGFLVLLSALSILADSLLLYDLGWKTAFAQRAAWFFQVAAVAAYVRMVRVELSREVRLWERAVEYGGLSVAALILLWPWLVSTPLASFLVVGLPVATLLPAVAMGFSAIRRSIPNSVVLMFTTFLLLACAAGAPFPIFGAPPLFPLHLGLLACAVILLLPIAKQFDEMMRREIALSRRLVTVRDLERTRLARDMHDGVGQSLAAVGLQLRLLARDASNPKMSGLTDAVSDLTEELREVIGNLRPSNLEDLPLGRAIERHLARTLGDTGLGFTSGRIEEVELSLDTKEHLFRIYQEALHNALRHSNCSNLSFTQKRVGRYLRLSISDDGCGFRISAEKNKGLGLSTMRERALLMNASLKISSSPDEGTTVSVEVPVS